MKKLFLGVVAAAMTLIATPAAAQAEAFDGARIGGLVGVSGDSSPFDDASFTYGGVAGYDFAVSEMFLLGVEADIASVSMDTGDFDIDNRQVSAALRGTYVMSPAAAVFVSAGYTNLDVSEDSTNIGVDFDGFRVGGGAEFNVSPRAYASIEYRYSEYDLGDFGFGNEGVQSLLAGVGLRF